MAAPGGDSLAILLPVPNLRAGVDWRRAADGLRDALVRDLERRFGLEGLGRLGRVEHRMAPPDFAREFGAVDGNAFAVEPTLHQSAYFRVPNRGASRASSTSARARTPARASPASARRRGDAPALSLAEARR